MKKKFTNDEIGQAVGKIAETIRDDMDYEFRVAQIQMWIAENDLSDCLQTDEQKKLFLDYCKKKNRFFEIAKELYQRKF